MLSEPPSQLTILACGGLNKVERTAHDGVDMQPRGINVPEIGVAFIEDQRQVRSSQNYGVDAIALDEGVGQPRQSIALRRGSNARGPHFKGRCGG